MSEIQALLIAVPALPLLAAIVTGLLGKRVLKDQSHVPTIAAIIGSCAITFTILIGVLTARGVDRPVLGVDIYTWFAADPVPGVLPGFSVPFSLQADTLSLVMLVAITFVGTFIAIFSAGYMKGD